MGVFTRGPGSSRPRRSRRVTSGGLSLTSYAGANLPSGLRAASTRGVTPPGPGQPRSLPYNTSRGLTAAARSMNLANKDEVEQLRRRRGGAAWQQEAWEYYDTIGEIKYALSLVANVCSRVRLYAAKVEDPAAAPAPADSGPSASAASGAAVTALARLNSAFGGQPGLIRDAALNIAVTGECLLVQQPGDLFEGKPESWDIRSVDELQVSGVGTVVIKTRRDASLRDNSVIKLPKDAFVGRIWRAHPHYSDEPDSSMLGVLDLCAELLLLNKTFRATARSRLNAGALYLPDGLSVAASPDSDVVDTLDESEPMIDVSGITAAVEDDEDEFEEALLDAMTTPITEEDSAAAVVPLIIRGPADLGEKIKQFKFERSFDPALASRSDRVLERIMQGIDVPKDIVTGLANVKYSNAVQIDDSLYKAHIEPLVLLLCDALTVIYLRPSLKAAGIDEAEAAQYVIWYDPTEVTTRPDRAEDADSGFEKTAISWAAWRRAHGFGEDDAPNAEETVMRLLVDRGVVTPELSELLFTAMAPALMAKVREASQAGSPAPMPGVVEDVLNGAPLTEAGAGAGNPATPPTPTPTGPFTPAGAAAPAPASDVVEPQDIVP